MSARAAFGRQFHRRHRWGLAALAAYVAVMAAVKLAAAAFDLRLALDTPQSFAAAVVVPMTATFIYGLAVFSFGLDGDLVARQSMYPSRLFTLPVTTGALAGWPMLYGAAAMAALWVATRAFAIWPRDAHVPLVWPALLAASLLAWTQALTWMPYPVRGLRVIVAVLWLSTIDAIVLAALHYQARETVMLALLAPHVPLAYLVARFGVERARHGHGRGIRGEEGRGLRGIRGLGRNVFDSPARAQRWFEWRRHGRSLPAFVALLLPFEAVLLWVFRDTPALVYEAIVIVLVTPPFAAGFVAAIVSRANPAGESGPGLPAFLATRPLSTTSMVGAALGATVRSAAAAWLLTFAGLSLALVMSGTLPLVADRARDLRSVFGTARTIALVLFGSAALVLWTWRRLVQGLYIGLTGRERLIKGYVFVTLALLTAAGPIVVWIRGSHSIQAAIWDALPWILAGFVAVKMIAAAIVALALERERVVGGRTALAAAVLWCAAVCALYGAFVWFVDTPFVPHYVLMSIAILLVPLARLSAAPLALARNRHR